MEFPRPSVRLHSSPVYLACLATAASKQNALPGRAPPGRVDVWCAELLQTDSFVFEEFPPPGILGLEEGGKFFRRVRLS